MASSLVSGTNAITIVALSNAVVILRDLKLQGIGSGFIGIDIQSAGSVYIEDCDIQNFQQAGFEFAPTNAGARLFVINSNLDDNSGGGIVIAPTGVSAYAVLDGVDANDNRAIAHSPDSAYYNMSLGFDFFFSGAACQGSMVAVRGQAGGSRAGGELCGRLSAAVSGCDATSTSEFSAVVTFPAAIQFHRQSGVSCRNVSRVV